MLDTRRLQTNPHVPVDGIIGVGTLTALFARMGAAPARLARSDLQKVQNSVEPSRSDIEIARS